MLSGLDYEVFILQKLSCKAALLYDVVALWLLVLFNNFCGVAFSALLRSHTTCWNKDFAEPSDQNNREGTSIAGLLEGGLVLVSSSNTRFSVFATARIFFSLLPCRDLVLCNNAAVPLTNLCVPQNLTVAVSTL